MGEKGLESRPAGGSDYTMKAVGGRKGILGRGHCPCEDLEARKTDWDWH